MMFLMPELEEVWAGGCMGGGAVMAVLLGATAGRRAGTMIGNSWLFQPKNNGRNSPKQ